MNKDTIMKLKCNMEHSPTRLVIYFVELWTQRNKCGHPSGVMAVAELLLLLSFLLLSHTLSGAFGFYSSQ